MNKRLRKKKHPSDWGSIALLSDDDVEHVNGVRGDIKGPEHTVTVVFWMSDRQRRREAGCSKNSVATYEERTEPKSLNCSIKVGTLHFTSGKAKDHTVVHEVIHASLHGERLLGGIVEERLAYRSERLFRAIQKFRDDYSL